VTVLGVRCAERESNPRALPSRHHQSRCRHATSRQLPPWRRLNLDVKFSAFTRELVDASPNRGHVERADDSNLRPAVAGLLLSCRIRDRLQRPT
jgi:hypothetical protein